MSQLFKKHQVFLLIMVGIVFSGYSVLFVQAKQTPISQQEVLKLEEEAKKFGKIWKEPEIRQSLEFFQKAAIQWKNLRQFQNSARCLREAVKLKLMTAEEKSAIALLRTALTLEQQSKNIVGEAETLSLLIIVSSKIGEIEMSKVYHSQALRITEKNQQPEILAPVLFASASFFYNERNFPRMLEHLEKALKLFRETANQTGETETLIELAYAYIINNDRIRGQDSAFKALEISKKTENLRNQVFALIVLADSYQRMGEWQNAVKYLLEAEQLFPENLDFFEKGVLNNRLGFYNLAYQDLNQAKKYFQKSYEAFDRIGNSEGRSELLTELGQIAVQQGNNVEAMQYFRQSRKIAEASNDPISLGVLDLKIGETFYNLQNFSAAEKHFRNALSQYQKIGIKYRIAEVQEKLGMVYEQRTNFSQAKENYLSALEMNRKILSKFAQAQTLFNLARLDYLQNQNDSALKNIKESITLTEFSQGETANSQLKRSYIANVFARYELYTNLLMKMHKLSPDKNFAIEALQTAEKSRARIMLENLSLSEADFTKDADVETVKREKEIRVLLNSKADKLTDLLSNNAEKNETDKISTEIGELEIELEEIKAKLKQQSPIYSAIKNPTPFDIAEFQNNILDENSLLLEFSFGKDESYLWLVSQNEVNSYVLPPREQIETHIEKLREFLKQRDLKKDETVEDFQKRINEIENNYRIESKELSSNLFGQIADKLSNKRLIIVPDGKLHYFPVSALPLPNSETDAPILLTNETVYEPSAQTLLLLEKSRNQPLNTAKNLLIFSDPIFTGDDVRFSAENKPVENANTETSSANKFRFVESLKSLSRLTASKDESDSIINIVGVSNADNFSGFSANREKLLNIKTNNYKIIHFATHGLAIEEHPELSGIVLSRFDEKGQKIDEFFRIHDIYGLNLNADLVVLSACETGIGKEVKGEGLMSLNNAFLQTGAKSVMASLWKVEDNATLELMKTFYGAMVNENLTPPQALRQAQIKLRQNPQYQSPFYWAAFTVQGDFKNVPKISVGFGNWIYLSSFVPFVLIGIYLYRKRKLFNRKVVNHT